MSRRRRIVVSALGLALFSFPILIAIEAQTAEWNGCGVRCPPGWQWWRELDWSMVVVCSVSMFVGAIVASALESSRQGLVLRLLRLTSIPALVAFPLAALVLTVLMASAEGLEGIALVPGFFALALFVGVVKYGVPALVVTAIWSSVVAILERTG